LLLDSAHLLSLGGGPASLARQAADLYLLQPAELCAQPFPRAFIERVVRQGSTETPERRSDGGLVLPPR
jgi:hypothetical protein